MKRIPLLTIAILLGYLDSNGQINLYDQWWGQPQANFPKLFDCQTDDYDRSKTVCYQSGNFSIFGTVPLTSTMLVFVDNRLQSVWHEVSSGKDFEWVLLEATKMYGGPYMKKQTLKYLDIQYYYWLDGDTQMTVKKNFNGQITVSFKPDPKCDE